MNRAHRYILASIGAIGLQTSLGASLPRRDRVGEVRFYSGFSLSINALLNQNIVLGSNLSAHSDKT